MAYYDSSRVTTTNSIGTRLLKWVTVYGRLNRVSVELILVPYKISAYGGAILNRFWGNPKYATDRSQVADSVLQSEPSTVQKDAILLVLNLLFMRAEGKVKTRDKFPIFSGNIFSQYWYTTTVLQYWFGFGLQNAWMNQVQYEKVAQARSVDSTLLNASKYQHGSIHL